MMADSSSSNMKKRGAANEAVELVQEFGLKRRSCSSSPLPTGSGHDTEAGASIEQLRWSFMAERLRELEHEIEKRMPHSINSPSCGDETEGREREVLRDGLIKEKLPEWENEFRQIVMKELDRTAQLQLQPPPPKPLSINSNQYERGSGSGTWKLRLRFCNQIANLMYHKDEIKAIEDMPLKFEICDAYHNAIIPTGLLSSAPFQFFLFEQENGSKTLPTFVSADKLVELISFNVLQQHRLENGIGYVKDLIVRPSSYWISKKFFLVVKVTMDEEILEEIGATIEDAVSEPFTVKTKRAKEFEKHNIPTKESEIWRLVCIRKEGVYHTVLSKHGITTVGDFLRKCHEMGSPALKKLLGKRMSMETWKKIVEHAQKCVGYDPTHYHQTLQANDHRADTNHSSEVHNPQNESVEYDNNNSVAGTEQLADSVHNSEAHDDINQNVETTHSEKAEVEANDSNNFKIHEQNQNLHEEKKYGDCWHEELVS